MSLVRPLLLLNIALAVLAGVTTAAPAGPPETIFVNPQQGDDSADGGEKHPLKSISAAIARLPDPVDRAVTIRLAPGEYRTTGARDMPASRLDLMRRMRPGVVVRIIGADDESPTALAWEGDTSMIAVTEGAWSLENVQIGTFSTRQRRGVAVIGPAEVTLKDARFRLRSHSDAGILAERGGLVLLRGKIAMNEQLANKHEQDETFCGIIAQDYGIVRFKDQKGASLEIGNGSLSARHYGMIQLGCDTARITSWADQSNNLAVNSSGRIDLGDTTLTLDARQHRNTPIGLEHDGHILGEGAHVIIVSDNDSAIALQKASTFTCNNIELRGKYETFLWASSGSMFVGRFRGEVGKLEATTGATINIEAADGALKGPFVAKHAGRISLPDRDVGP